MDSSELFGSLVADNLRHATYLVYIFSFLSALHTYM